MNRAFGKMLHLGFRQTAVWRTFVRQIYRVPNFLGENDQTTRKVNQNWASLGKTFLPWVMIWQKNAPKSCLFIFYVSDHCRTFRLWYLQRANVVGCPTVGPRKQMMMLPVFASRRSRIIQLQKGSRANTCMCVLMYTCMHVCMDGCT
jgi:hypothetical protein